MSAAPSTKLIPTGEFQEMIRTRKTAHKEESERRRQNDLRRIQDMKSKIGLDPLERFPEEIWLQILDELHPEDKRNIGQVHPMFKCLMEASFIRDVLFPQILGFEIRRRSLWPDHKLHLWNSNTLKNFAHYTQLRLVSKSLRNGIDRWFENDLIAKMHFRQPCHFSAPSVVATFYLVEKSCNSLNHKSGLLKMLEDPCPKTPLRFYIRSLSFIYPSRVDAWEPCNEITTNAILDRIGDQIWFFSFEIGGSRSMEWTRLHLANMYTLLMGWLDKMPNLKWLSLRLILEEEENQNYDFHLQPSETLQPRNLAHLERVDLHCNVPQFAKAILKTNPNVKTLCFRGTESLDYLNISRISTIPVEGLSLEKWGGWKNPLNTISSRKWPLKWANLSLGLKESVFSIFRDLSNFKTLEKLSVRFFTTTVGNDVDFLDLPNLGKFEVLFNKPEFGENESANFFMTFQYLLHAEKLNFFSWHCAMVNEEIERTLANLKEYDPHEGKITFGGCWPDFNKSNIFKVFPALVNARILLYSTEDKCWRFNRTIYRR